MTSSSCSGDGARIMMLLHPPVFSSIHPPTPPTVLIHPEPCTCPLAVQSELQYGLARGRISQDAAEFRECFFPEPPTWSRHAILWKWRFRPSPIGWRSCETRFVPFDISRVGGGGGGVYNHGQNPRIFHAMGPGVLYWRFLDIPFLFLISSKNQISPSLPAKVLVWSQLIVDTSNPTKRLLKCGVTSMGIVSSGKQWWRIMQLVVGVEMQSFMRPRSKIRAST